MKTNEIKKNYPPSPNSCGYIKTDAFFILLERMKDMEGGGRKGEKCKDYKYAWLGKTPAEKRRREWMNE